MLAKFPSPVFTLLLGLAITQTFGCTTQKDNSAIAQTSPKPAPQEIVQPGEVRALPGKLDKIPVFNSNSPEWIKTEGILLSTFPPDGKKIPAAHLNFPFQGRFDLFAHHYSHTPKDLQTLYLGVIVQNPGKKAVTVDVLQAASYLMQDAPFVTLSPYIENWQAKLVDNPQTKYLTIPQRGKAISYGLDTLLSGRLGTQQIQTAKMLVRYPDTAYEAHGNYGVEYKLTLPLSNNTNENQTVTVTLETPLKEDKLSQGGVRFRKPSLDFPFFRGTVRLRYFDDQGQQKTRYIHLWHRTGQVLEPLVQLVLPPSTQRIVQVDVIYPPDSTPPQVLSVRTLEK